MDASSRRGRKRSGGGRTSRRAGSPMRLAARLAIVVSLVALLPHLAAAQSKPAAKPGAKIGVPAQGSAPAQNQTAPAAGAPELDLAFGAFQRGYFLTAFRLATQRVEDKGDAKSMTLLGELYANGLGV